MGAACWVTLALLIAGGAIAYLFTANVERTVRVNLEASLARLVAAIDAQAPRSPALAQSLPDPRYEVPLSGVYWQVEGINDGQVIRSRSLWDSVLDGSAATAAGGEQFTTIAGPGGQSLLALAIQTQFSVPEGTKTYRIVIAEDRAILDLSIAQFSKELALALLILGMALILAAWLQVRIGLSPLARLREGIEAIRDGTTDRVPGSYPSEVMPLVGEVEALLASQQKSMEFARARAADLAHGLKTPLSVLAALSDRLREKGDTETAELVGDLADEMADRVDYQLRLSRLRLRTRSHVLNAPLDTALARTINVLQRTRDGEDLKWNVESDEGIVLDIDPHDLIELMGVLLENATRWSRTQVKVIAVRIGNEAEISISDDGKGLTPAELARIGERGQRLDETAQGSGLGLAIAREIIAQNDGSITFGKAVEGGVLVTVRLPIAG